MDLITAKRAAEIAGVNRRTITRWAESGRLRHAVKIDGDTGAYLFTEDDVLAAVLNTTGAAS